jgi:hypothetical protein
MPVYFSSVAPTCPISRDSPTADSPRGYVRTTIPKASDLPSAINAANIARSIVTSLVVDRVTNNVYTTQPPSTPKSKRSSWVEDKSKRIKRRHRYYVEDEFTRQVFSEAWIDTERIERMVWVDRGWNVTMTWIYGDKGDVYPNGPTNENYYGDDPPTPDDRPPPDDRPELDPEPAES